MTEERIELDMTESSPLQPQIPWYKEMNRYHWWILMICVLGWSFDTLDQRLFSLGRADAMNEFFPNDKTAAATAGRTSVMFFIFGWATGGIIFGILGDKWGRAKTMMLTILVYALFTAGSGFAQTVSQFNVLRFLTGLGVGGEFAAGVALMAEVIPERPRPYALGLMQGLSAGGNILGSLIGVVRARFGWSWRVLFFIGAFPALLVVYIRRRLKEPESWVKAKEASRQESGKALGSYWDLFTHPRWRRNAMFGVGIAIVGVTGLWGIGFYTRELIGNVLRDLPSDEIKSKSAWMLLFQDVGAFFSMYGFAVVSARIGRKPTFILACLAGFVSVVIVQIFLNDPGQIWWMGLILGFGTLALFGGYAIYFPELFPTRLRATGVSLCYNVGRYMAAIIQVVIPKWVHGFYTKRKIFTGLKAFRATNITLAMIYIVGMILMLFAPETQGKPLPTDDDAEAAEA